MVYCTHTPMGSGPRVPHLESEDRQMAEKTRLADGAYRLVCDCKHEVSHYMGKLANAERKLRGDHECPNQAAHTLHQKLQGYRAPNGLHSSSVAHVPGGHADVAWSPSDLAHNGGDKAKLPAAALRAITSAGWSPNGPTVIPEGEGPRIRTDGRGPLAELHEDVGYEKAWAPVRNQIQRLANERTPWDGSSVNPTALPKRRDLTPR